MTIGVYAIKQLSTDRMYIGSSVDIERRKKQHVAALKLGIHHSIFLQRSWHKNGPGDFVFGVIEKMSDRSGLYEREQYWIDSLRPAFNGTKLVIDISKRDSSHGPIGRPLSPLHRQRISEATKGLGKTEETKQRMSEGAKKRWRNNQGTHLSDETKQKISTALIGREFSEEHRRKLSENNAKRKDK
jgi:group I intron endonuclease